jgi:hypothetical protein
VGSLQNLQTNLKLELVAVLCKLECEVVASQEEWREGQSRQGQWLGLGVAGAKLFASRVMMTAAQFGGDGRGRVDERRCGRRKGARSLASGAFHVSISYV